MQLAHVERLVKLLVTLKLDLLTLPANATDEQLRAKFANLAPTMLALNKCPDFVVNRGHYFGTGKVAERTRAQRRRQARADRVPEDVLDESGPDQTQSLSVIPAKAGIRAHVRVAGARIAFAGMTRSGLRPCRVLLRRPGPRARRP